MFCGYGYQYQNQCFQGFRDQILSWLGARNFCLQRGGDLAKFDFITTDIGLNMLNGSWLIPSSRYWIGLRREWWTWQSNSKDIVLPFITANWQLHCLLAIFAFLANILKDCILLTYPAR